MPPGGLLWTWVRLPSPPPDFDAAKTDGHVPSVSPHGRPAVIHSGPFAYSGTYRQEHVRRGGGMAGTRWGLEPAEWAAAKESLRGLLRQVARSRSTVTYAEAANVAFEGRFSARSGALDGPSRRRGRRGGACASA